MKKCVSSIFTIIAFLLLNVTNVYADSRSQTFTLSYIKGAPPSETYYTDGFTFQSQNSREIIINVSQLTQGAQLVVSSFNLNSNRTVIDKVGTYHISLLKMSTGISVTVNMKLIPDESTPVAIASGYISY